MEKKVRVNELNFSIHLVEELYSPVRLVKGHAIKSSMGGESSELERNSDWWLQKWAEHEALMSISNFDSQELEDELLDDFVGGKIDVVDDNGIMHDSGQVSRDGARQATTKIVRQPTPLLSDPILSNGKPRNGMMEEFYSMKDLCGSMICESWEVGEKIHDNLGQSRVGWQNSRGVEELDCEVSSGVQQLTQDVAHSHWPWLGLRIEIWTLVMRKVQMKSPNHMSYTSRRFKGISHNGTGRRRGGARRSEQHLGKRRDEGVSSKGRSGDARKGGYTSLLEGRSAKKAGKKAGTNGGSTADEKKGVFNDNSRSDDPEAKLFSICRTSNCTRNSRKSESWFVEENLLAFSFSDGEEVLFSPSPTLAGVNSTLVAFLLRSSLKQH
ncbi:hypothetical protein VNO78_24010 [Psophocarpus tetragonolobus]|uniref:Uncharacterized protein n=1 Tax=Psophocarpus tetragonolobus TaxID=3891 RepID=A0AAN9XEB9_PSOTE